jgi:O-antigen chain-terminating methyltransferase
MSDQFYRAFEEKFRGSHALIQQRLEVYVPFIKPVTEALPQGLVLDLGCGRGEWLALMQHHAIPAMGVDLDAGMLAACQQQNLNVQRQDALAYLKQLNDGSAAVISAFHLVEHLSFEVLKELVSECQRVLAAGGLLIMETPNPENFMVATQSFYLDPTHVRPIPPDLLAFVPEYLGYETVKILRLQESADVKTHANLSMQDVFMGASPDYAVVAQKAGQPQLKHKLQSLFDQAYGISGLALLERHRLQTHELQFKQDKAISNLLQQSQRTEAQVAQLNAQLTAQLSRMKAQLDSAELQLHNSQHRTYKGVIGWVLTQIIRLAEQGLWSRLAALVRKSVRLLASPLVRFVNQRPQLKMRLGQWAQTLGLSVLLKQIWSKLQTQELQEAQAAQAAASDQQVAITPDNMSNSAQRIAQTLQAHKRT